MSRQVVHLACLESILECEYGNRQHPEVMPSSGLSAIAFLRPFVASLALPRSLWRMTSMPLSKNISTLAKLDKLAESLFEKLEQLKAAAREMAEHQASIEEQIRSLEGSKG
jgi:hypothetical protein